MDKLKIAGCTRERISSSTFLSGQPSGICFFLWRDGSPGGKIMQLSPHSDPTTGNGQNPGTRHLALPDAFFARREDGFDTLQRDMRMDRQSGVEEGDPALLAYGTLLSLGSIDGTASSTASTGQPVLAQDYLAWKISIRLSSYIYTNIQHMCALLFALYILDGDGRTFCAQVMTVVGVLPHELRILYLIFCILYSKFYLLSFRIDGKGIG